MPEYTTIDPSTITALKREFIASIHEAGLVLLPEAMAKYTLVFYKECERRMRKRDVSTQEIENFELIEGVKSRQTVIAMIKDGRLTANEWYKNTKGDYRILTSAIRRLNAK